MLVIIEAPIVCTSSLFELCLEACTRDKVDVVQRLHQAFLYSRQLLRGVCLVRNACKASDGLPVQSVNRSSEWTSVSSPE